MTTQRWRRGLSDTDRRAIRDVIDAATAADGTAPVGDQVLRELAGDRTAHLVALDGDATVGYLNLTANSGTEPESAAGPAMAELAVHPRARRRGIGTALLRAALERGGSDTRVWAHGDLPPARALAAALNMTAARELWQMRRDDLAGLPAVSPTPGIDVRTYAGASDDAELLRVNNAAFAWHPEQGGWTERDLADRRAESWFDPAGLFMASDTASGALLGFHWTKVHPATGPANPAAGEAGRSPELGEVYVVGVDPAAQGRGLGRMVTLLGLHHLAARLGPDATVMLYVEASNSAAVATYRRLGFQLANTDVAYTQS